MRKMMKSVVGKKGGMANLMKRMSSMQGGMGGLGSLMGNRR
jgi:signal recognition particle subunit SRP54